MDLETLRNSNLARAGGALWDDDGFFYRITTPDMYGCFGVEIRTPHLPKHALLNTPQRLRRYLRPTPTEEQFQAAVARLKARYAEVLADWSARCAAADVLAMLCPDEGQDPHWIKFVADVEVEADRSGRSPDYCAMSLEDIGAWTEWVRAWQAEEVL